MNTSERRDVGGRWVAGDPAERLMRWVDQRGVDECWPWTGALDSHGHGQFAVDGRNVRAHRAVYELLVGPIAEGMTLDHLCHTRDSTCAGGASCPHRRCVNPSHAEQVTLAVNKARGQSPPARNARKTHCVNGHELAPDNLVACKLPVRKCRTCHLREMREYQARRHATM